MLLLLLPLIVFVNCVASGRHVMNTSMLHISALSALLFEASAQAHLDVKRRPKQRPHIEERQGKKKHRKGGWVGERAGGWMGGWASRSVGGRVGVCMSVSTRLSYTSCPCDLNLQGFIKCIEPPTCVKGTPEATHCLDPIVPSNSGLVHHLLCCLTHGENQSLSVLALPAV